MGHATPYNPVFTGRDAELADIERLMRNDNPDRLPVPVALYGMGGVGKSQTARRYVDIHREEYAAVCWVRGEKPEDFIADMAGFAHGLGVDPPIPTNQREAYEAVKARLDFFNSWLLIVDNADELLQLRPLLPQSPKGRVLLTAREAAPTTLARTVEIRHFDDEIGATLFLRRANLLQDDQSLSDIDPITQADALQVSADLGGLALALEAAGAYIQVHKISPAKYREYYAQRRQKLHTDNTNPDHDTVTVTFSLALEQIEWIPKWGIAAAQLVKMCAFLAPDTIPDEIFLQGAKYLEPELAQYAADEIDFQDVIATATKYALIRRETRPNGLWMHRLAQEVIRDSMSENEQKAMRRRIVIALQGIFPIPEFDKWELCERLLSHALVGKQSIVDDSIYTDEAGALLNETARYLRYRARYAETEQLYRLGLAIDTELYGERDGSVAMVLNNLGVLLRLTGRYQEAAEVQERAVAIDRSIYGEDNLDFAIHITSLAQAYCAINRIPEAAKLSEQALDITKRHLGADHADVATNFNNLANVYSYMGRFDEAILLLNEALAVGRKTIGENHPDYATRLLNLASLHIRYGQFGEANNPLQQALTSFQAIFGAEHPNIAYCDHWFGRLRYGEEKREEAAMYFQRALKAQERTLGADHPETIASRSWLAKVIAEI